MSYSVSFSRPAEEDMISALAYIRDVLLAPEAARNLLVDIEEQLRLISSNPYINPLLIDESLRSRGFRRSIINNHLLFYCIDTNKNEVNIIRFLYNRRDWNKLL